MKQTQVRKALRKYIHIFLVSAYVPTLAPSSPVFPYSYMARECGVNMKYRVTHQNGHRVPNDVYNLLSFKASNFRNGYFNYKEEDGGKVITVSVSFVGYSS